ncbi:MFS transporter [Endozoicomonas lisbonensis]|uniref:MFS family permease n=1 Tax=Endozoicomonas lisbonensis TaxID=3120522 RepID=A0ABV2SIZ6_9GAMM
MPANVRTLFFAQAFAMCATPLMIFSAALATHGFAPSQEWTTLPVAVLVIGMAMSVYPAAHLAARWGRKRLFLTAMLCGVCFSMLAMWSLVQASFWLFVLASGGLGAVGAVSQQFRFAAMESVQAQQRPLAASRILVAGLVSAWLGPELVIFGQHWFSGVFEGAFVLLGGLFLLAFFILSIGYQNTRNPGGKSGSGSGSIKELLERRGFLVAAFSGAVAYCVMGLIMTATPISMNQINEFSLTQTKWVIQSHIMAMFIPSLFAGWLVQRLGHKRMIVLGLAAYLFCVVLGVMDQSFMHYWWALVLLGVGWNFLFVAGTSLLPDMHSESETAKAQGLNDFLIFGCQSVAALTSGLLLHAIGWVGLLLVTVPLCVAMLGLVLSWNQKISDTELA